MNKEDETGLNVDHETVESIDILSTDIPVESANLYRSMSYCPFSKEDDDAATAFEKDDTEVEVSMSCEVKNTSSVLLTGTVILLILLRRGRKSRS